MQLCAGKKSFITGHMRVLEGGMLHAPLRAEFVGRRSVPMMREHEFGPVASIPTGLDFSAARPQFGIFGRVEWSGILPLGLARKNWRSPRVLSGARVAHATRNLIVAETNPGATHLKENRSRPAFPYWSSGPGMLTEVRRILHNNCIFPCVI